MKTRLTKVLLATGLIASGVAVIAPVSPAGADADSNTYIDLLPPDNGGSWGYIQNKFMGEMTLGSGSTFSPSPVAATQPLVGPTSHKLNRWDALTPNPNINWASDPLIQTYGISDFTNRARIGGPETGFLDARGIRSNVRTNSPLKPVGTILNEGLARSNAMFRFTALQSGEMTISYELKGTVRGTDQESGVFNDGVATIDKSDAAYSYLSIWEGSGSTTYFDFFSIVDPNGSVTTNATDLTSELANGQSETITNTYPIVAGEEYRIMFAAWTAQAGDAGELYGPTISTISQFGEFSQIEINDIEITFGGPSQTLKQAPSSLPWGL